MSNPMRLGLIVVVVVVIVVGFVLASSTSDDADDPERAATQISTAATAPAPAPTSTSTATTPAPPPEPATPVVETLVVAGGAIRGGVKRLRFDKGERVRFRVRSDVADEIHVHGYDERREVAARGSAAFDFEASIDGRFEVELERSGVEIAHLEVQP